MRGLVFALLVVLYALVIAGVIIDPSPVLSVDQWWLDLHQWAHYPQYHDFIAYYVILGQRGPATLAFLPVFVWVAWRRRTTEPLVLLATSLVLLNVSVGIAKYAIGRLGPSQTRLVHQVFDGGNIFPSGHVANAVVLYGLLAWILPRQRKWITPVAVFVCITVGWCTIYLRTHWFSDVVGGWIAGALVLLALPTFMPTAQRWTDQVVAAVQGRRLRRRRARAISTTPSEPSPPVAGQPVAGRPLPSAAAPVGASAASTARRESGSGRRRGRHKNASPVS